MYFHVDIKSYIVPRLILESAAADVGRLCPNRKEFRIKFSRLKFPIA